MNTLYSSVHHEMLGPLKASAEAAMLDCVPASIDTPAQRTTAPKHQTLVSLYVSLTQLSPMRMETKSINFA